MNDFCKYLLLERNSLRYFLTENNSDTSSSEEGDDDDDDDRSSEDIIIDDYKLIQHVQNRPMLWNSESKYTSENEKQKLWGEIVNVLCNDSVSDTDKQNLGDSLQKRWEYLHTHYKCLVQNVKQGSKRKLPRVYQLMHFLDGQEKLNMINLNPNQETIPLIQHFYKHLQHSFNLNDSEIGQDTDFKFLLSIFPVLKSVPEELKHNIKTEIIECLNKFTIPTENDEHALATEFISKKVKIEEQINDNCFDECTALDESDPLIDNIKIESMQNDELYYNVVDIQEVTVKAEPSESC